MSNTTDPTTAVLQVLRADQSLYSRTTRETIGDGEQGTYQTLSRMAAEAKRASTSGVVLAVASAIVGQQANRDNMAGLLGLDLFLRQAVKFKQDTLGAEVLVQPEALLQEIGLNGSTACGCDDLATLGASIVRAMGHKPFFVIYRNHASSEWKRVAYAVSVEGSRPIPFDPEERVKPGRWSATPGRREVVEA